MDLHDNQQLHKPISLSVAFVNLHTYNFVCLLDSSMRADGIKCSDHKLKCVWQTTEPFLTTKNNFVIPLMFLEIMYIFLRITNTITVLFVTYRAWYGSTWTAVIPWVMFVTQFHLLRLGLYQSKHQQHTPCYCHYLLGWHLFVQVKYSNNQELGIYTNCSILSPVCGDCCWQTLRVLQCWQWSSFEGKCNDTQIWWRETFLRSCVNGKFRTLCNTAPISNQWAARSFLAQ